MGSMSPIHWVILAVIVLVLFGGGGKISSLMGDFAKGIKSFKKGMSEEDGGLSAPQQADERLSSPQDRTATSAEPQQKDVRMADDEANRPH